MSDSVEDPRCPECGEPIGQTATYCMHCSADLTAELEAADADENGVWDQAEASSTDAQQHTESSVERPSGSDNTLGGYAQGIRNVLEGSSSGTNQSGQLLAPDGLVDDTLTVVVGIIGGILAGLVGTIVLGIATGSPWALLFGFIAWMGSTAYLVRLRTVQEAIAKSGYVISLTLLLVPTIALSPVVSVDGGLSGRGSLFLGLLLFVSIPALIAAVVGWVAAQFVPEEDSQSSE